MEKHMMEILKMVKDMDLVFWFGAKVIDMKDNFNMDRNMGRENMFYLINQLEEVFGKMAQE